MIAENDLESKPGEDAIEDRQCGNAMRGQGPGGEAGGRTAVVPWVGLVIRSARRFRHRSIPWTQPVGLGVRRPVGRDVRRHGCPRGEKVKREISDKILTSTCLDASGAALDLRQGGRRKSRSGGGRPATWTLPVRRTRRRIAVEARAWRTRDRTGLDAYFPPGEDDPTFNQLNGNSEIMRARCAESRVKGRDPAHSLPSLMKG